MALTHRERVLAVLSGERPDRPVVDLGGRVASRSNPAYLVKARYGDRLVFHGGWMCNPYYLTAGLIKMTFHKDRYAVELINLTSEEKYE